MKKKITNKETVYELKRIYKKYGSILSPENVVIEAKYLKSPLHKHFNWNDTEAAHQFRLVQARKLLQIVVDIIPSDGKTVRIFYSLKQDRQGNNTGYRTTVDILSDRQLYKQLLEDAKSEMQIFISKYEEIKELKKVFSEMKKLL